jgi:hypothetical protein
MTDAGHPSRHGFKRCARCGAWRRAEGTEERTHPLGVQVVCSDDSVCTRLAGVGAGRIEAANYDANGMEVGT